MRLVAVDEAAAGRGLVPGDGLSEARARVPELEVREIDRAAIAHAFAAFADWHSNASPVVAVLEDSIPYGDLVLDITGVAQLFGGETQMLDQLVARLRRRGFTVYGAIADTIGAAWGFAHFAAGSIVGGAELAARFGRLPVVGLRLGEAQVAGLNQLGLKQIGQLYGRDRKALQARFGLSLLTRLDQALGRVEERITPRLPLAEYQAERRFAEPIGLMDDVLMTVRDLAVTLGLQLAGAGLGAQSFQLLLYRVDHKLLTLTVNAARATRDPGHIAQLFSHRAERLGGEYDAGFGIDMIRLAASMVSEVAETQIGAFDISDGAPDLDRLYDRMASRLGPQALLRSKPVNTHIPERAVKLEPVLARSPDDPEAAPDPLLVRPIRLLAEPEPISVIAEVPHGPPLRMIWRRVAYGISKASGPERIEAEWWRAGGNLHFLRPPRREADKPQRSGQPAPHVSQLPIFRPAEAVRDYFIVEDEGGRRFWIFRLGLYGEAAGPSWFLHGFFA